MNSSPPTFSLVYVSHARPGPHGRDEQALSAWLAALQAEAAAGNRRLGVRGLLVYAQGQFIQWLQGPEPTVRALMAQIEHDPRHEQVLTVYTGAGGVRLEEWSMSLVSSSDGAGGLDAALRRLRAGELPAAGEQTPAAIFRDLAHPPSGGTQPRGLVGVIGQTGLWPGALLSHLSSKWRAPLQRTRLQGQTGFEREALVEYMDAEHPRLGRLRLVSYSGDAIAATWMERTPERYEALVLFYSSASVEAALSFTAMAVQRLGEHNAATRLVCLFGRLAVPCRDAVQAWLDERRRTVRMLALPLADSEAVWQAVEQTLGDRPAAAPAPVQAASVPAAPVPAAPARAAKTPAAPAARQEPPPHRAAAAPARLPAGAVPAGPVLSAEGQEWLTQLLEIDGVAAVALGPLAGAQGEPALLLAGGDAGARQQQRRQALEEFACELALQARLRPDGDGDGAPSSQLLTRYADRVVLSRVLPGAQRAVLYVSGAPGYYNEALLLRGVELCVGSAPARLFDSSVTGVRA